VVFALLGTCYSESLESLRSKAVAQAKSLYPDLENKDSALRQRMDQIFERLEKSDSEITRAPNRYLIVAQMAAEELGIRPNSGLAPSVDVVSHAKSDPELPEGMSREEYVAAAQQYEKDYATSYQRALAKYPDLGKPTSFLSQIVYIVSKDELNRGTPDSSSPQFPELVTEKAYALCLKVARENAEKKAAAQANAANARALNPATIRPDWFGPQAKASNGPVTVINAGPGVWIGSDGSTVIETAPGHFQSSSGATAIQTAPGVIQVTR